MFIGEGDGVGATRAAAAGNGIRIPTQARGKRTFAAILEATAELLVTDGMDAVNTNVIAKRAHVNVATVYSYFPDKTAIVRQLAQQFEDERFGYVEEMAQRFGRDDWREWYATVIDRLAQFRLDVPGAVEIRKIVRSSIDLREIDEESTRGAIELIVVRLSELNPELSDARARAVAGVVVRTITEVIDSAFATDPPDMALVEELKVMVIGYLEQYLHGASTVVAGVADDVDG